MSELLPAARSPWMPAENLDPVDVALGYRASKAVVNEGERQLAEREAEANKAASRGREEARRNYNLYTWGPNSDTRAKERVALQERYSAEWMQLFVREEAEVEALRVEFQRRAAEVRARWAQVKAASNQQLQREYDALLEKQKAGFDPQVCIWEMKRNSKKRELEAELGANERRVREGLAAWEQLNPRPGGK